LASLVRHASSTHIDTDGGTYMKASKSTRRGRRPAKNLARRKIQDVKGGRDAATGLPTGKRQHTAITIVKEWGVASS